MIILNCKQGSDEWKQARLGIPTASQFSRIITPKTLKPSSSAEGYIYQLVAEYMLGEPLDDEASDFMLRGTALEEEAVRWYEFERMEETTEVGFILRDDRRVGCSPDRLVGEPGGLEVKCPSPAVHIGYLDGNVSEKYRCQVQGGLWISGRQWWDVLSYHPLLPKSLIRVERDEKFIAALEICMESFLEKLDTVRSKIETLNSPAQPAPEVSDER